MKRIAAVPIFLLIWQLSFTQGKTILLDGKINKYPIVMEIWSSDSVCMVKYFYLNQVKDILLEGSIDKKGNFKAVTDFSDDKKADNEQFELTKTSFGYTGTWKSSNKKLEVKLKELSLEKYKNQYQYLPAIKKLKQEDKYNYIRSANLQFIADSNSLDGSIEVAWYREKYSGIVMPRIKAGYSTPVLQKINAVLLEKHLTESISSIECIAERWGEYHHTAELTFANKDLLSFNVGVGYYCGGAHPDFASEGLSFNTQTGELLKLDDVIWFGGKKTFVEDSHEWYDYRDSVFSIRIIEIFKRLYPEEMKVSKKDDDFECNYAVWEVWTYPNWHFTDEGLYLGAIFPRVDRSCDSPPWSVIPYKELKNYLHPRSKIRLPG